MNAVKRVLLADCDEIFREELRRAIDASSTMQVVGEAADGVEALKLLASLQPDLLVTDLQLPYVAGLQVLEQTAQISPRTVCVVISAFSRDEVVGETVELGARDFIRKPCNLSWTVGRLAQLVQPQEFCVDPRVTWMMQDLRVPVHVEGYRCLCVMGTLALREPLLLDGVTKWLYPKTAKLRHSTRDGVERAARRAIELGCDRGMLAVLEERYGRTLPGRPSIREFVTLVVELIRECEAQNEKIC